MKRLAPLAFAGLLTLSSIAQAHRLDEYLQIAVVALNRDHIGLTFILTPGVAVSQRAIALMDTNGDGVLSPAEGKAYVARVIHDLALSVDGHLVKLGLVSSRFPKVESMRKGLGSIELHLAAPASAKSGTHRVVLENHHQKAIAAYMVNCVVPDDPALSVGRWTSPATRWATASRRDDSRSLPKEVRAPGCTSFQRRCRFTFTVK